MSNFYIYFISSLPMLHFGARPPFSFEKFLERAGQFISDKDTEILKNITLQVEGCGENVHPTLKKWLDFEVRLRNELVKVRAAHRHIDANKYLRDYQYPDMILSHLALSSHRAPSILEAEKILDEARWRFWDESAFGHYFDCDFLIIYALRLLILERWEKINTADKLKVLERVLQ